MQADVKDLLEGSLAIGQEEIDPLAPQAGSLGRIDPSFEVVVVGQDLAPQDTDTPLKLAPSHTFEQVTEPFALIAPGGTEPTLVALTNEPLLSWLRKAARRAEVIGSVCTGSLILGAAGLLDGRQATTHWGFRDRLAKFGATPVAERWVEAGPVLTAAPPRLDSAAMSRWRASCGRLVG